MTLLEDVQSLRKQVEELEQRADSLKTRLTIVEIEAESLKGLRKAAYWLAALIVASAIGFGFSVLSLVHA